ncbi:MAG: phage portal protein [Armatimonadota bacterium]
MRNPLDRFADWLAVKAAQRVVSRLPYSGRTGAGYGARFTGSGWEFVDYLATGGRPLPIQPHEAGDLRLNSIVAACLQWISTSWPQAVPQVGTLNGAEFVPDKKPHPLTVLLRQPSPHCNGRWLIAALNEDFWFRGNAYAQIITGRGGLPAELNYLPARSFTPVGDDKGYLSHYRYEAGTGTYEVDPAEILHFRYGISDENPLEGVSPLRSGFREIVTDNSASDYAAGLFRNGGMPPALLTPRLNKDDLTGQALLSADDAEVLTKQLSEKIRAQPGHLRFISAAMELLQLSFKPGEMGLEICREEPETRIPALFGIPPVVVGLRAGTLRSTYNNVETAFRQAWNGCLSPLQDYFAEVFTNRLLPLYPGSEGKVVRYDRSNVGELQPDMNALRDQARKDHQAGIITLEEARAEGGRQTDEKTRQQLQQEREERMPPALAAGEDPKPEPDPKKDPKKEKEGDGRKYRDPFRVKSSSELWTTLDSFRTALRGHEDSAVEQMTAAYETTRESIQGKLDALTERMEQAEAAGETISEAWLAQETRYEELLSQIEASLSELAADQAEPLAEAQRGAVTAAADYAQDLTRAALGEAPEGVSLTWNRLSKEALEAFVGFAGDGSPLHQLLEELGPDARDQVKDALLTGIAEGRNPRAIAGEISKALDGNRARALTIARTEVHRASREASRESYAANSDVVEGWTWVAKLDTETCAGCWAMHGSHHAPTQILDDHPNGRCVMVPRTKSWAEILGDSSIPDTRPVIPTGESEFLKLSEEQQKEILGPGMWKLWKDGKVQFSDLVHQETDERWGTMRRPATLAEAQGA